MLTWVCNSSNHACKVWVRNAGTNGQVVLVPPGWCVQLSPNPVDEPTRAPSLLPIDMQPEE